MTRNVFRLFIFVLIVVSVWMGVLVFRPQSEIQSTSSQPETQIEPSANPTPSSLGLLLTETAGPTPATNAYIDQIPEKKQLSGGSHSFQTFNNCGPASLSMALSYYGIQESQQDLGRSLRPFQNAMGNNDDKSVTLQELASKAEELNLIAYYRPAGDIETIQQFLAQDIPVITRTLLTTQEDIGHYRVLTGYDLATATLTQDDSLQGNDLVYSVDEFKELWKAFNYEFLVLVPASKQKEAEVILGELLQPQEAWQRARDLAERQIEANPEDDYALFNLAVAHYQLDDYEASREVFEKVESRIPKRTLWYQIDPILAYFKLGHDERVMSLSEQIIENGNRAFSELHYLRAQIHQKRGDVELANESLKLAERYNEGKFWKVNLGIPMD